MRARDGLHLHSCNPVVRCELTRVSKSSTGRSTAVAGCGAAASAGVQKKQMQYSAIEVRYSAKFGQ